MKQKPYINKITPVHSYSYTYTHRFIYIHIQNNYLLTLINLYIYKYFIETDISMHKTALYRFIYYSASN